MRNSPLSIKTSPAKFLAETCAQVPLAVSYTASGGAPYEGIGMPRRLAHRNRLSAIMFQNMAPLGELLSVVVTDEPAVYLVPLSLFGSEYSFYYIA